MKNDSVHKKFNVNDVDSVSYFFFRMELYIQHCGVLQAFSVELAEHKIYRSFTGKPQVFFYNTAYEE